MATFADIQTEIALMLDSAEELTPEQQAAMDTYLDELAEQEASKIDSFALFVKEQSAKADFYVEEAKRIAAKGKSIENRIAFLKSMYLETMRRNGLQKTQGSLYTLSTRKNTSVAVTAMVDVLPDKYKRIKTIVEADKVAIKAALVQGNKIDGCELVESLSLQIK